MEPPNSASESAGAGTSGGHAKGQAEDAERGCDIEGNVELLALPSPEDRLKPLTLNVATGESVALDHLGPVIVTTAGGLERITNWAQLSEGEQQVARRRIAKRNMERLKKLRGEEDADATPATPATAAASAITEEDDEQTASPDESSEPKVVAVLGSGKFGTAMAVVMARNGHTVRILTRRPEIATSINESHKHPICFVDTALSPKISATTDAATALAGVDYIVHAVPVQASAKFLSSVAQFVPPTAPVVSLSKGIDVVTLGMMVDVIKASLGPDQPCCCLSGPSFASELVDSQPTGMVLACSNLDVARHAATLFHSKTLRVYLSEDVVGVEICGALKNVYAIAAGAAEGMGLGLNSAALLVTRANKEMARVCIAKGAQVKTVSGLSGVGDLMLTCFGKVSRNRTVGKRMGQGETVAQILATSTEVAEGITTTPAAARLARALSVKAPIIFAMEQVVSGVVSPKEALLNLMSRPMSVEDDS